MNTAASLDQLYEFGLLSSDSTEAEIGLFRAALERLELSPLDYLTMRDLLPLAAAPTLEVQALLILMFDILQEGSLCLPLNEAYLRQRLSRLSESATELLVPLQQQLAELPEEQQLIAPQPDAFRPLLLRKRGNGRWLYWQRYFQQERQLESELRRLLCGNPVELEPATAADILEQVLHRQPLRHTGQPLTLNNEQQLALALGLLQGTTIISGGPGTGKTSIVISLLRCLTRAGLSADQIRLAAPTGRAAQRLTDSVNAGLQSLPSLPPEDAQLQRLEGHTLHHLLRYRPSSHSFVFGKAYPLPIKALIVDEVSMVDVSMMTRLLQAVGPDCRLILLGDKDQLPSVEAGALLAELVPDHARPCFSDAMAKRLRAAAPQLSVSPSPLSDNPLTDHLVILRQTYRSSDEILQLAHAINNGKTTVIDELDAIETFSQLDAAWLEPGCHLMETPAEQSQRWQELLKRWTQLYLEQRQHPAGRPFRDLVNQRQDHELEQSLIPGDSATGQWLGKLLDQVEAGRILTALREGRRGCHSINSIIGNRVRQVVDPQASGSAFSGMPIMITRNSYRQELFNGDVGLALRDRHGQLRGIFRRRGEFRSLPMELLPTHESAFAITVHKSQGSEFQRVLLVLPNQADHRLLTREIAYTGLTRAKQVVVIAGTRQALTQAVHRRVDRQSGLALWPGSQPQPASQPAPQPPTKAAPRKAPAKQTIQLELPFDNLD